ncbi:MAG: tyrosine-type recombinase/integrase [Myxococcota bacterium]
MGLHEAGQQSTRKREAPPVLRGLEAHDFEPDANPVDSYLERLRSKASRTSVRSSLKVLADIASGGRIEAEQFPWHRLTYRQGLRLRSALVELYEPAGVNAKLSALREVVRECFVLELVRSDHLERILHVKSVPESTVLRGREARRDELVRLAEVCRADKRAQGPRDFAVFSLLAGLGVRSIELARAQLSDVDLEGGVLTVRRKGGRVDQAPLSATTVRALRAWIEVRGNEYGALFYACDRSGGVRPKPIGRHAIRRLVERRRAEAGLEKLTPHDLRRTLAGQLLDDEAVDLGTAKRILGHRKTDTLLRYDHRPLRADRKKKPGFRVRVR